MSGSALFAANVSTSVRQASYSVSKEHLSVEGGDDVAFGIVKNSKRRSKNAQNEDATPNGSSVEESAFRDHIRQAQKSADSERVRESFKKLPSGFKF